MIPLHVNALCSFVTQYGPETELQHALVMEDAPELAVPLMETLHKRAIEAATEGKNIPDIRTGDIVQLRVEVPENKKRVSLLRGICIGRQNAGIHTTFRIRRVIAGVGVEMVFPLYSPNIKEIKVVDKRKVRRAKLYYLRDKIARLSSC
ncbi:hypothetical protein L7F22_062084 [Adiantum nelumboides]|nr:hypothetical protein [Adiantum nelumboides]